MERLRRLDEFWSWLPAFRAVAETEHLPSAAEQMHSSAPALSRAVHKLEARLGLSLFRRTGRRIERNEAGDILLAAVREAMRQVHEALLELEESTLEGRFRVASSGFVAWVWLLPSLARLRTRFPGLLPELVTPRPAAIARELLQGHIDLALLGQPIEHPVLETTLLAQVASSVYCGPGHPLFGRSEVALAQLQSHAFVVPQAGTDGQRGDGWPPALERRIGMVADTMQIGLEVCAAGSMLAVLPDVVASWKGPELLQRVPVELEHRVPVFAIHRPVLREGSSVEVVLEELRAVIAST